MLTEEYLLVALAAIVVVFLFRRLIASTYAWKFRGRLLVTCPENQRPAVVRMSALRAALGEFVNRSHLEVSDCSRWPEQGHCPQECVCQIERNPDEHRLWNVAAKWFDGKECAICHKPIERLSHMDHSPAVMNPASRKTVEWENLPPEQLPAVFAESVPVCWSCHIAETFLRKFPGSTVARHFHREI
jgi:hypothetical protein